MNLKNYLALMAQQKASDLVLSVGAPPESRSRAGPITWVASR
jgi:Tfp pilus assembly ATPase PilU